MIQISMTCERYDRCSTVVGKKGLSMKQISLLFVVFIFQDIFSRQQKAGKVRKNKHHVHGPLSKKVLLIYISSYWKALSMAALL
jgi:hypothetical protein